MTLWQLCQGNRITKIYEKCIIMKLKLIAIKKKKLPTKHDPIITSNIYYCIL